MARMMMLGVHFMDGVVPFKEVYIHALVRDEKGQKMSKSKGNVLDPIELIDKYGADSLRFTLAAMAAQGRDIKMSTTRLESYRNFSTKIWNACRFLQINDCIGKEVIDLSSVTLPVNKWIVAEFNKSNQQIVTAIESYRFNEAADAVYDFVWHSYCDWYVELIKPELESSSDSKINEIKATASAVLSNSLRILHPFMPYLTEELNQKIFSNDVLLIASSWPNQLEVKEDNSSVKEISFLTELIKEIRYIRSEMNVPLSARPALLFTKANDLQQNAMEKQKNSLLRLGRISGFTEVDFFPKGTAQGNVDGLEIGLPIAEFLDVVAERNRLTKEFKSVKEQIDKLSKKLNNSAFLDKAPDVVVESNKMRLEKEKNKLQSVKLALSRVDGIDGLI